MNDLDAATQDAYTDRNLLAQLCGALAHQAGYDVWWQPSDEAEPGWPVLMINLPEGQISYHIPQHQVCLDALIAGPPWDVLIAGQPWDGHTTDEKRERIRRFLAGG